MDKCNHADEHYMGTDDQSNSVNDNLTSSVSDLENEETNPFKFLPVIDSAQFAIEKQYSAEEAKLGYLLKLPYNVEYKEDDLNDEKMSAGIRN
jgi:hypothetical protein